MRSVPAFGSIVVVALASAALAACNGSGPPPGDVVRSSLSRAAAPSLTSPDVRAASAGNAAFAMDLHRSLPRGGGNAFYSPWSISSALAMTYAGAAGATATEMAHVLHFTLEGDRLHAAFNAIDQSVAQDAAHPAQGTAITWRNANALFAQRGKVFLPAFLDTLAANYGAGVSLLDFRGSPEPSRSAINGWVSGITEGHIAELLPTGTITPDTRLVLTNAVYFHAPWQHAFETSHTHGAPFHRADGTDVTVQLMSQETDLRFAVGDGWQAVEIPYANRAMTMLVVVPAAGTLESFESSMDAARIAAIDGALQSGRVNLGLPRFSMRSSFFLRDTLVALGMTSAFSGGADLSGMDGTHELSLSDVVHQAWVDVTESGTDAAAATAVIVGVTSVGPTATPITLDHPFVFFIRDVPSGAMLFAGRVADPTAASR